jgi:hypothetical protein
MGPDAGEALVRPARVRPPRRADPALCRRGKHRRRTASEKRRDPVRQHHNHRLERVGLDCSCDHEVEECTDNLVPPVDSRSPVGGLRNQIVEPSKNLGSLSSVLELCRGTHVVLERLEFPAKSFQLVGCERCVAGWRGFAWSAQDLAFAFEFGPQARSLKCEAPQRCA